MRSPTLSHTGTRVLLVFVFLFAVPLIHGGVPWILSQWGPHWGWTAARGPGMLNWSGLVLITGSVALLSWILVTTLGEVSLMPTRVPLGLRPTKLVQTGPYAWTRHPLYLAELLLWTGVATYFGSPIVLSVMVAGVVIGTAIVIPREERALESYFGDEYREYSKRVPSLAGFKPRPLA